MLAVSLYLIWFNSWQKTPQTEFAILVVFSFINSFSFFSEKQILWVQRILHTDILSLRARGAETKETTKGEQTEQVRERKVKKSRSNNELCFSAVNVGHLVNCLVVLKDSWNWKTYTEMLFFVRCYFTEMLFYVFTYLALDLRVIKVKPGQTPSNSSI